MKYRLAALLFVCLSCNTGNTGTQTKEENKLIGAWKAVADQQLDSNNNVIREDTTVAGLIIYTQEGKMSAQILWKGIRSQIMNDSIMKKDGNPTSLGLGYNTWNMDELKNLVDSYDSYFGDYAVDWKTNTVTHIMTGNLRPEKEGTIYKRIFRLKDDSLFLRSADPAARWQMAWIRVKK